MTKIITRKKRQQTKTSYLTLGPLFFHWSPEKRRDFYYRIADESVVDCVYIGEVICSKREPFFEGYLPTVIERLQAAGKEVVLSTLALITSKHEINSIKENIGSNILIEANDVACLQVLKGKPHIIGPFINVFNEGTRDYLVKNNAQRIVLPVEMAASAINIITKEPHNVDTEVMVFGRQPLSVAMRCYHARSYELNKDSCQFVCSLNADGLPADTIDGQHILTVNGTQTMSHGYVVLLDQLKKLQDMGVTHFRISPQNIDMIKVAAIYRKTLDGKFNSDEAITKLKESTSEVPFVNGFIHGKSGLEWINNKEYKVSQTNNNPTSVKKVISKISRK